MTIVSRSKYLILIFILSFLPFLWSCAQIRDWTSKEVSSAPPVLSEAEQKPVPPESSVPPTSSGSEKKPVSPKKESDRVTDTPRPPSTPLAQIADQTETLMNSGDFQKALDIYRVAHQKYPDDKTLLELYVKSIKQLKSTADESLDREDFIVSGRRYHLLIENYPAFDSFKETLLFTGTDLAEKLSVCKKTIAKRGFEEYRKGNLDDAITLWQALLEIEPDNEDIKEVLNRATLQWKNLQD